MPQSHTPFFYCHYHFTVPYHPHGVLLLVQHYHPRYHRKFIFVSSSSSKRIPIWYPNFFSSSHILLLFLFINFYSTLSPTLEPTQSPEYSSKSWGSSSSSKDKWASSSSGDDWKSSSSGDSWNSPSKDAWGNSIDYWGKSKDIKKDTDGPTLSP